MSKVHTRKNTTFADWHAMVVEELAKNGKVHHGEIGKDIVDDINQYFGISQ